MANVSLASPSNVCQASFRVLFLIFSLGPFSNAMYEGGAVSVPISQMAKLKQRERQQLGQGYLV